jgi:ribosomal protein S27AE
VDIVKLPILIVVVHHSGVVISASTTILPKLVKKKRNRMTSKRRTIPHTPGSIAKKYRPSNDALFNEMFDLLQRNEKPVYTNDLCPKCGNEMMKDYREAQRVCECGLAETTLFAEDAVRMDYEDPSQLNKMLSYYTKDVHW